MARLPTGAKRQKFQQRRKKEKKRQETTLARGKATGGITTPTRHVPTKRTPEQFAKLSPAQQLYVRKGIVSSSEEGATRLIEGFNRKTLAKQQQQQPPETPTQAQPLEPSPLAAEPIVAPGAFAEGMVTPGLTAEKAQLQETATPENFGRDVAVGTAIGAAAIAAGAAAVIIPGLAGATAAGTRLLATGGLTSKAVGKLAGGKLTSQVIKETIKLGGGKVMTNTYTVKLGLGLLSKITKYGKWALGTFGILSGFAFAAQFLVTQTYNDSADAVAGYTFAMAQADREDDEEEVQILGEQLDELHAAWEETDGLGIFNYPKAASNKIKESKDVADSIRRRRAKPKLTTESLTKVAETIPGLGMTGGLGNILPKGVSKITQKFIRANYDDFLDFFIKKAGKTKQITQKFIRENYDDAMDFLIKRLK